MGCINSKCIAQSRQQDTDDFYSVGDINQPRWLSELKKYDENEELMLQHALDCVQKDTGNPSKLPKATYEIERRLSRGEFKFTNTSEKPSTSGLSKQQAPNIQPMHQLLTLPQEGPPASSGAVRKRRNGLSSRNDQCHKTPKTPTKKQQVPTPAQKGHKDGQETCVVMTAEVLPTPMILITQPEEPNALQDNEVQLKKANDSKENADTAEDFQFKLVLDELRDLKRTHVDLLHRREVEAEHQMKVQQKIQEELSELQKALCHLVATFATHCATISEQFTLQGSAVTQAIKSLTAVLEKMPFIAAARVREETSSSSQTTSHED